MSCDEYVRLIHLNVEGELSEDERNRLWLHVAVCEGCAAEVRLVRRSDQLMNVVRASPTMPDPDQVLRSVLKRTGVEQATSPHAVFFDNLIEIFLRPRVRFAYAAFVLLAVSTFMIHQVEALRSADELSTRFTLRSGSPGADVVYTLPLTEAVKIAGAEQLEPLIAAAPVSMSGNRLRAHKSDIDPWVQSVSPRVLCRILASSVPNLRHIPVVVAEMQQSVTTSFTLRFGGNNK